MEHFKNLYDALNSSEDLQGLYPGMTGEWEKDKTKFIRYQTELENLANDQEYYD